VQVDCARLTKAAIVAMLLIVDFMIELNSLNFEKRVCRGYKAKQRVSLAEIPLENVYGLPERECKRRE